MLRSIGARPRGPPRAGAKPQPPEAASVEGGNHHSANMLGEASYRLALHELFGVGAVPAQAQAGTASVAPATDAASGG